MGKIEHEQLPVQQPQQRSDDRTPFFFGRCPTRLCRLFTPKCIVFLMFSFGVFLSAVFWVLPLRSAELGFDAKGAIKFSAPVQAYFRLQKPVSELVPYVARLEYDINGEIGVPLCKVAVLSMHRADLYNSTNVVFGFLPDPINSTINPVSLSVLKFSLLELFLQQSNLTLTGSIFGETSSFEILKFPGGISVIPERSAMILPIPQILFNFTLNNSIDEIKENFVQLKEQLKVGLHLRANENIYIQVTNNLGSTRDPLVTVDASVLSDLGMLLPDRLRQLAEIIKGSPAKNLGLDHAVFGRVKEIGLSSFLNNSLDAPTPSPAPAPSPEQVDYLAPSMAPSYSSGSPAPSASSERPHCGSSVPPSPFPASHSNQMAPSLSPYASRQSPVAGPAPPHISAYSTASPLYFAVDNKRTYWFFILGIFTMHLLFWTFEVHTC